MGDDGFFCRGKGRDCANDVGGGAVCDAHGNVLVGAGQRDFHADEKVERALWVKVVFVFYHGEPLECSVGRGQNGAIFQFHVGMHAIELVSCRAGCTVNKLVIGSCDGFSGVLHVRGVNGRQTSFRDEAFGEIFVIGANEAADAQAGER